MYTDEMLGKETIKDLVAIYNNLNPVKKLKSFRTKATGIKKILELQHRSISEAANTVISINGKKPETQHVSKYQEKQVVAKPQLKKKAMDMIAAGSGMTNKEFSEKKSFVDLCNAIELTPTSRQASKFRMGKGLAYASII